MELLGKTQLEWMKKLYQEKLSGSAATPIPESVFKTLKTFNYVEGDAAGATITPNGAGQMLMLQKATEADEKSKNIKKKGKQLCSKNSQKNTDPQPVLFQ